MAFKDKERESEYKNQFAREKYDRLSLVAPKDEGQQIKQAAAVQGESVNEYIRQAVRRRMDSGL